MLASVLLSNRTHAQIISTVAGDGTSAYSGDGGAATAATFSFAASLTRDAAGNTYVVDLHRIRKIDASGNISTIAGGAFLGFTGDGGPATAANINIGMDNSDIICDNAGNIYFTDVYNSRIRKINTSGDISTIAGSSSTGSHAGDGGAATAANLNRPCGLALDAAGNMYIADNLNHVVRKIDMGTGIISTIVGTPSTAGYSGDGGAATAARLRNPVAVAVDAAGNLYIAEYHNNTVRKVSAATGIISTLAGDGTAGSTGDGGAAASARLRAPSSVGIDQVGNIFIADISNHAIRKINIAGTISTVVGTNGTSGYSGDGGPATAARLSTVTDLYLEGDGSMYVTDLYNYRLRKVAPAAVALSGTASACVTSTNTLIAATTGGAWTSGNTAVATVASTGVVTGVSAGTATISYAMGLGFGSTVFTVNPLPVPVVSASGTLLSVAGSYTSYQWRVGGAPITGATSATYEAPADGSYAVTVTDANGCTGTSAAVTVAHVGINEVRTTRAWTLYPNPATEAVNVAGIAAGSKVQVMDIAGRVVYESTATASEMNVSTSNIAAGLYLVKVSGLEATTRKLVVSK